MNREYNISSGPFYTTLSYRIQFTLPANFEDPSLTVNVHSDNVAYLSLNGTAFGNQLEAESAGNFLNPAESFSTLNASLFAPGLNTLRIDVYNFSGPTAFDFSADVTFTEVQPVETTLVMVLDLVPDGAIDVSFHGPGGGNDIFLLDDDDDPALPSSRSFPLAAGSYVVGQAVALKGYEISTTCTDPDGETVILAAGGGATVDLDAGETVTCIFTNRVIATLVMVFDLVPDGAIDVSFHGPGGGNDIFLLDDDDDPALPSSRSFPLAAGSYVVGQAVALKGYEISTTCTDPDGETVILAAGGGATVDLDAGETVTCTFTNRADTTPPALTLPDNISINATSPAGATFAYTVFATDLGDPSPTVACLPASGSVFPIGSTTVTCTATDGAGNSTGGSFMVHVRGAGEQIVALTAKTLAFVDRPALEAALKASLTTTANALAAGRNLAACSVLSAYRTMVSAAPAISLTPAEKVELIADATRIRRVIGCASP